MFGAAAAAVAGEWDDETVECCDVACRVALHLQTSICVSCWVWKKHALCVLIACLR